MHAWAASDTDGSPRFFGGTPGGANQLPWNAQTLARIISGEDRPRMLVTSPLWEWLPDDDGLCAERGFTDEVPAPAPGGTRVVTAARWN